MTNPIYRTVAWAKASRACLARDGRFCLIRMPNCEGAATTADHIVELEDGGEPYALENLQAACRRCNTAKGNRARARRAKLNVRGVRQW